MSLPNSVLSTKELLPSREVGYERRAQQQTYSQALTGAHTSPCPAPSPISDALPLSQPGSLSNSVLKPTTPSFVPSSARDRRRSVSFSLGSTQSSLQQTLSPLQSRGHASESGSPTLEQVLMMGNPLQNSADTGYGSYSLTPPSKGQNSNLPTETPGNESDAFSPPQPSQRPTLADVVGIDLAVAQAVQNLQSLQLQQQALLMQGHGEGNLLHPGPLPPHLPHYPRWSTATGQEDCTPLHPATPYTDNAMLNSILDSVTRPRPDISVDTRLCGGDPLALERAARQYRSAASVYEASCTWSGQLPPRSSNAGPNSSYSTKIFLGGVPWDISEQTLVQAFAEFGEVRIEWPGRDYTSPPRGYLYLVFQDESEVTNLLSKCSQDYNMRDSYYYRISSRRMRSKEVQIIPWVIGDSNFVRCASPRLDPQKTVFVGALHGMMTAQGLAVVFNDLFAGVVYAGLDTDKYKYPIGSGRVTFNNSRSYMKAVAAAFIEIKTPRFCKKVQVDPYLEDTICSVCSMKQGPYFCRDLSCFNYFCHGCWDLSHSSSLESRQHKPLMRNIRGLTRARQANNNYTQEMSHMSGERYGSVGGNRRHNDAVGELASRFGEKFSL